MSKRIVGTWIVIFTVISVALGTLAVTSDGPLPSVDVDQVHTAPGWG